MLIYLCGGNKRFTWNDVEMWRKLWVSVVSRGTETKENDVSEIRCDCGWGRACGL